MTCQRLIPPQGQYEPGMMGIRYPQQLPEVFMGFPLSPGHMYQAVHRLPVGNVRILAGPELSLLVLPMDEAAGKA